MLLDKVHAPVARMMCTQCHEPPGAPNALAVKQGAPALCRGCHAQKLTAILDKNRVHQPVLEGKACLNCHGPHASKRSGLLRGTTVSVCGSCHADTIRRNEKAGSKHKPVAEGDCSGCHDPHSASGALLLHSPDRVQGCAKCHEWTTHSSHPLGAKFADPRNKNLKMECLSCHRAHGTEFAKLMPYPKQTDMCVKCHESYRR
jgi:predicted CXXCH cytochrome family protein